MNDMAVVRETITPERASFLLQGNTMNRAVKRDAVIKYSNDMANGKWAVNGETIKIAKDGTLIDGQHRLIACMESGHSFETFVLYGADKNDIVTVDGGAKRTAGDALKIKGVKNGNACAALAKAMIVLKNSNKIEDLVKGSFEFRPSNSEIVEYAIENMEEVKKAVELSRSFDDLPTSRAILGAFLYVATKIDKDDAEYFIDKMKTGVGLEEKDPILKARNSLIKSGLNKQARTTTKASIAILVKAWNKYMRGEEATEMKFRIGGSKPERFPEMIDQDLCKVDYSILIP